MMGILLQVRMQAIERCHLIECANFRFSTFSKQFSFPDARCSSKYVYKFGRSYLFRHREQRENRWQCFLVCIKVWKYTLCSLSVVYFSTSETVSAIETHLVIILHNISCRLTCTQGRISSVTHQKYKKNDRSTTPTFLNEILKIDCFAAFKCMCTQIYQVQFNYICWFFKIEFQHIFYYLLCKYYQIVNSTQ